MKAKNQFVSNYAVYVDGVFCDLHNCYSFIGFEHCDQRLSIRLTRDDGDGPDAMAIVFDGVRRHRFQAGTHSHSPRDSMVIELIGAVGVDHFDEPSGHFCIGEHPGPHCIMLTFEDGALLIVDADSIEVRRVG